MPQHRIIIALSIILTGACDITDDELLAPEPKVQDRLFADETFEATTQLLEERGIVIDWSGMSIEKPSRDNGSLRVELPIVVVAEDGVLDVGEVHYEQSSGSSSQVSVVEYALVEGDGGTSEILPPLCDLGAWVYMDSCYIATYQMSQICPGGKLWRRDRNCRQIYENGRQLSGLLETEYSCSTQYGSSGCSNACYDDSAI